MGTTAAVDVLVSAMIGLHELAIDPSAFKPNRRNLLGFFVPALSGKQTSQMLGGGPVADVDPGPQLIQLTPR